MGFTHLPKVMVFTPVYRLEPETVEAVLALDWDGAITWHMQRDNPHEDGKANVLHQYQEGRKSFLNGDYGMMLVIESDIIPPPDTLTKLYALNADLAYGVYQYRASPVINVYDKYFKPDQRNPGQSLSIDRHKLRRAVRQRIYPCTGGALGCVLIQRHVLEAVEFRDGKSHCDSQFNRDVLGYSQVADMSVICGHKTPEGEILWPKLK